MKNNSFVPGWPILKNVKWQWKNIKSKNAFPPRVTNWPARRVALASWRERWLLLSVASPHYHILLIVMYIHISWPLSFRQLFCFWSLLLSVASPHYHILVILVMLISYRHYHYRITYHIWWPFVVNYSVFDHIFAPQPLIVFLLFWLLTLSLTRWSTMSATQPTLEQLLVMSSRW